MIRSHLSCLESHGERLVAAPVRWQDRAQEVGAVGPDQLAGVVREDVHHVPGVRSGSERTRGGHGAVGVSNLAAGEGRGGRREPSGGGRLYGNMHHNSWGQCHLTGLYEKSRTLWRKKIQSVLIVFAPDAAGFRSVKGWRWRRTTESWTKSTKLWRLLDHLLMMRKVGGHRGWCLCNRACKAKLSKVCARLDICARIDRTLNYFQPRVNNTATPQTALDLTSGPSSTK